MNEVKNEISINGMNLGSGQCIIGSKSSEYRGRLIVASSIEEANCDVRDYGSQVIWRNGCVQDAKGNILTPNLDCSFLLAGSWDHGIKTYYSGWAMIGDFILLYRDDFNDELSGLRLWDSNKNAGISGKTISFEEVWQIATPISEGRQLFNSEGGASRPSIHQESWEGCFQGCAVSAVRFIDALNSQGDSYNDAVMEARGKALDLVCKGSLDAALGAARIYMDGFGWRWLFPSVPAVPSQSLSDLMQSDCMDDWKRMKPLLTDLSGEERNLVQRHFLCLASKGNIQGDYDSLFSVVIGDQHGLIDFEKNGSNKVCHPDLMQEVKDAFSDLEKQDS